MLKDSILLLTSKVPAIVEAHGPQNVRLRVKIVFGIAKYLLKFILNLASFTTHCEVEIVG